VRELLRAENAASARSELIMFIAQRGDRRFNDEIIANLADADADVSRTAEEALYILMDSAIKDSLFKTAGSSGKSGRLRAGAVRVLARNGTKREVELFISLLDSDDPELKAALFEGLSQITHMELGQRESNWHKWWQENRDKSHEEWIEQAMERLREENRALERRLEASRQSHEEELAEVRAQAARAVIDQIERRLVADDPTPLIEGLDSPFDPVVLYCLRRLAETPPTNLPEGLAEKLIGILESPFSEIRAEAAGALGGIRDAEVGRALEELLSDEASVVRRNAARSIGRIEYAPAVVELVGLLSDPSAEVRMAAAAALGDIEAEHAASSLIRLLSDPNADVRWEAAQALGKIKAPSAVGPLIQVLDDQNPRVRWYACDSLGKIGDLRAVEPLMAKLTDPDAGVRESALNSLVLLNDLKALPAIERLVEDNEQRVAAKAWNAYVQMISGKKEALRNACEKYLGLNEYDRALELFTAYLEIYGNDSPEDRTYAEVHIARIHLAQDRQQEAFDIFDELVRQQPDNVEIRSEYVAELLARGMSAQAAQHLPELIKRTPEKRNAYFEQALAVLEDLSRQNKHQEVVAFCVALEAADATLGGDETKAKILAVQRKSEEALSPPTGGEPAETATPGEGEKEEAAP
jgi:HEAT repeat protein